jgi:hypothetical protein
MRQKFFFYGTLGHEMVGETARSVHQKLAHVGSGYVIGKLFTIAHSEGYYPAFVQDVDGYEVTGNVYEANPDFTKIDLDALDEYEEYHPKDLGKSEYLRKVVAVNLSENETVDANIYLYNQALPPTTVEIPSGSFATFIKEGDFKAFGTNQSRRW